MGWRQAHCNSCQEAVFASQTQPSLLPVFLPCVNNGILGHLVYFVGYLLYVIVGGGTVCRQQGFHYPRHVDDDLKMTAA